MRSFQTIALLFFVVTATEGFSSQVRVAQCATSQSSCLAAMMISSSGKEVQPGSDLFPGKSPYVPGGLSAEEYSKLKKDEANQLKKMNFGAWGPRFKRTDAPDGDWMVMTNLWTNGFNSQREGVATGKSSSTYGGSESPIVLAARFLRSKFPALLLSFIFFDTLTTAIAMSRTANLTARQAILTILKVPSLKALSLHLSSILKMQTLKLAAVTLLAPAMGNILEIVSRRRLWSTRRTIGVCTSLSLGTLSLWAVVLRLATIR
jgi:hypothetical protein